MSFSQMKAKPAAANKTPSHHSALSPQTKQDGGDKAQLLQKIYRRLYRRYGPQHWWPGDGPLDVVLGAILTQSAAWTNVELALRNLRAAGYWSLESIHHCSQDELARIIRPSGYFNAKARKLRALGEYLGEYEDDIEAVFGSQPLNELREELLGLHGVGPETADSMLLYAGNLPNFVIDAYTMRVLSRLGIIDADERPSYDTVRALFHKALPTDVQLFNEYHALFVAHGKDVCKSRNPLCGECVLLEDCPAGAALMGGNGFPDQTPE